MKITEAVYLASAFLPEQFPPASYNEIAFAGRSNVGKSSLLNSLLCRKKLAHTSGSPGKTRTINFFLINNSFYFVDLPGYGYARVSEDIKKQWHQLMESYFMQRETLKLVALLVDIRHPPSTDDCSMYKWFVYYNLPTVIVATKADKISRSHWPRQLKQIREVLGIGSEGPVIPF